jgi:hypothetical protein
MRSALKASRLRPRWSPAILRLRSSAAASNTFPPRLRPEPSLGLDLYRRADAHDREADYRAVREAGRAVWLTKHRMWASSRVFTIAASTWASVIVLATKARHETGFLHPR